MNYASIYLIVALCFVFGQRGFSAVDQGSDQLNFDDELPARNLEIIVKTEFKIEEFGETFANYVIVRAKCRVISPSRNTYLLVVNTDNPINQVLREISAFPGVVYAQPNFTYFPLQQQGSPATAALESDKGYIFAGIKAYLMPLRPSLYQRLGLSLPVFESDAARSSFATDLSNYEMPANSPYFRVFEFGLNKWTDKDFTDKEYIVYITEVAVVEEPISSFPIYISSCGFDISMKIIRGHDRSLVGHYKGRVAARAEGNSHCSSWHFPSSSLPGFEAAGAQIISISKLQ